VTSHTREPVDAVLPRLKGVREEGPNRWRAFCPVHEEPPEGHKPSLSVRRGEDGRVLLKCHATNACTLEAICAAMGLEVKDLFPAKGERVQQVNTPPRRRRAYATAESAAKAIARRVGGKCVGQWTYHDADGTERFRVLRFDLAGGGKEYRPIHPTPEGWVVGDPPGALPLHGLPLPDGVTRVYAPEGEKCAEELRAMGLTATTSAHGAKSAHKTDWTPLAGREVIILPDNDAAGEVYAEAVATILTRLAPPATVRIVRLPDLPEGGDVVDWLDARDGKEPDELRAALEQLAEEAPVYEPEVDLPPDAYRPFPVPVLPEPIRSYVIQSANAIGCDASFIALPVLCSLAGAIGNTRRIQLKRGWCEPAVAWGAIIADSGRLKSPAQESAVRPLRERQAKAMREHAELMDAYVEAELKYQAALKRWQKGGSTTGKEPPKQPREPVPERYLTSDPTVEALAALLVQTPRGMLLCRDELAGWIRGFDAYKRGHGGDAAYWLEMHRAGQLLIDRKTTDRRTIFVPRAAVSVTGTIQPQTLRRCIGREHVDNGLAARLLFAMPPPKPKRWTEAEVDPGVQSRFDALFDGLLDLEFGEGDDGQPTPIDLPPSADAKQVWVEFYNEHGEETMAHAGTDLAAAWAKLEGYAARLGLVVHMVRVVTREADASAVDEVSIRAGIALARWFAHEARRVYSLLHETEEQREERRLIDFIRAQGGRVTARDLQRGGPCCKTAAEANGRLDALADAGRGHRETAAPGPMGGKPKDEFVLHDATDTDNTSRGPPI